MLLERLARVTVLQSVLSEVFDKAGYRLECDTAEGQTLAVRGEAGTAAGADAAWTGAGPDAATGITGNPSTGPAR